MKAIGIGLIVILMGIAIVEGLLQLLFGFGRPPLYQADDKIGYLLAPDQRLRRFGNRIEINQYSMRSHAPTVPKPAQTLRVFLIGDSIVNGNWWTDQTQTLSALLEQSLTLSLPALPKAYSRVEVLNASANSWGPRNQKAYLERFGTFESQLVVLVLNTDDLFATEPTSLQVGRDRSYPNISPRFALVELANRYLKKPIPIPELKAIQAEPGDRVGLNLKAVQQIKQQVDSQGGRLILVMTPLKREVLSGPRDYEVTARERVDAFVAEQTLPYLDLLPVFSDQFSNQGDIKSWYRDHIHLSPTGNQVVCDRIQTVIQNQLAISDISKARQAD
ncbi:MAG: SGNH/GDSL hydrolase family protein [Cyanobacteria bacterium P01_A01_bin.114]